MILALPLLPKQILEEVDQSRKFNPKLGLSALPDRKLFSVKVVESGKVVFLRASADVAARQSQSELVEQH